MSSGSKYRCEIVLPEDSPYRDYVKDLEWKPFDPLPPKGKRGNQARARSRPSAKHHMLTEDGSVMVGYFTGPDAFSAFKKVFGEEIYVDFREAYRDGMDSTRIYTLFEAERLLDKPIHKQLLRLCVRGGLSAKRKREVGGIMRALDYGYMRILDGTGKLISAQREAVYMLGSWGYDVDEEKRIIKWPEGFTFTVEDRRWMLSKAVKRRGLPPKIKKELQECLLEVREEKRDHLLEISRKAWEEYDKANPPIDWRRLFRAAKAHFDESGVDYRKSGNALGLIRRQFGSRSTQKMEGIAKARLSRSGITKCAVGDLELDASSLVRLACDGYPAATATLADLLAGVDVNRSDDAVPEGVADDAVGGGLAEIPEWAMSEKAVILRWADDAQGLSRESPEGQIASYLRAQIGRGRLNVLVFDGGLYDEVVQADLAGGTVAEIESFPFHTALIRLPTFEGVVGIAVFRWEDLIESANQADGVLMARYEGYGMAYLTTGGGIDLNPDADLRHAAEKLVVYLDCDNAHVETVYVDGGTSRGPNKPNGQQGTFAGSYVRGADVVTGAQVVVEREVRRKGRLESPIIRRAHFRRGYYARRRIGTREEWHYEKRWIKPTFVHGGTAIVTERRVRRLML